MSDAALVSRATIRGVWLHLHFHDLHALAPRRHRQVFIPMGAPTDDNRSEATRQLDRYLTESMPRMFPGADLAECDCVDVPQPAENG